MAGKSLGCHRKWAGAPEKPGSIHPPKTGSLAAWTTCRLPFSHDGSTIGWVSNYLLFSCGTHHLAYLDVVIWHGNLVPIQRRSLCARETRCSHHLSRRASDPSCRWRGTSCASSTVPPRQRRTHDGRIEPTSSSSLHGPGLLTKWATQASLSTPERGSPDEMPYVSSYLVRPAALLPAPASPVRAPPFPYHPTRRGSSITLAGTGGPANIHVAVVRPTTWPFWLAVVVFVLYMTALRRCVLQ